MFTRIYDFLANSGPSDTISNLILNDPNVTALREGVQLLATVTGTSALLDQYLNYLMMGIAALVVMGYVANPAAKPAGATGAAPGSGAGEPPKNASTPAEPQKTP